MCPDKKRPAENTCRIVKGLDAVWAHFCPSKPCLPSSIDGKMSGGHSARMDIRSLGLQCSAVMMASSSRTASSTVSLMTK